MEHEHRVIDAQGIFARAEALVAEENYPDAVVVAKDLLPCIPQEQYLLRMRAYLLLVQCPGADLTEDQRWRARAAAEDVIARSALAEEHIQAHLLHVIVGPFPNAAEVPPGAGGDGRKWLHSELRELQAWEVAGKVLGKGGGIDRDIQRKAHVLLCHIAPDQREIEAHLEVLLQDGDERSIVQGCCGASEEFHRGTRLSFLDRAVALAKEERNIAVLLEYQLCILSHLLMVRPDVSQETREQFFAWVYQKFVAAFVKLQRCEGAVRERACGHVYLAMMAEQYDDCAMAEVHLDIAKTLFQELGTTHELRAVKALRVSMGIDDEDGGEDGGEAEQRTRGSFRTGEVEEDGDGDEENEEDEDDDDDDWWNGE